MSWDYHLVMTNSSPWYTWHFYRWFTVLRDGDFPGYDEQFAMVKPWPIEIDGLPDLKMGGSFHGELLNSQMVNVKFI